MTESRFRELIARRGLSFSNCDGALRAIALGVCDYLTEVTSCPVKGTLIPLEGSIIPVVEGMFLDGQKHHVLAPGVDGALLATTAAWAISAPPAIGSKLPITFPPKRCPPKSKRS